MARYVMLGLGLLAIAAFVPCIFFGLRARFHFISMLGQRKSDPSGITADLDPFLAPLRPQQSTDQGNVHCRAFLKDLNWALIFGVSIATTFAVFGNGEGN